MFFFLSMFGKAMIILDKSNDNTGQVIQYYWTSHTIILDKSYNTTGQVIQYYWTSHTILLDKSYNTTGQVTPMIMSTMIWVGQ